MKLTDLPNNVLETLRENVSTFEIFTAPSGPLVLKVNTGESFLDNYLMIVGAEEWFLINEKGAKALTENERSRITVSTDFI